MFNTITAKNRSMTKVTRNSFLRFALFLMAVVTLLFSPVSAWAHTVTPTSHDFGNITVGQSATVIMTLTNTSRVATLRVGWPANSAPFSYATAGTAAPCGATLAPLTSCTVGVTFTPTSRRTFVTRSIFWIATQPFYRTISGNGIGPAYKLTSTSLNFGPLGLGASQTNRVTVTSVGEQDLILGNVGVSNPLAAPFSITANTCNGATLVPTTGSCVIDVTFTPTAGGILLDSFDIPSNDPRGVATIWVRGTGETGRIARVPPQFRAGADQQLCYRNSDHNELKRNLRPRFSARLPG